MKKSISASGEYFHKTSQLNLVPGISIGDNSFAVSISVTNSTQINRIPMDVIAIMIFK